jgi:hypothetical protein
MKQKLSEYDHKSYRIQHGNEPDPELQQDSKDKEDPEPPEPVIIPDTTPATEVAEKSVSAETYSGRYCSKECQNFRSVIRKCPARNADYRAMDAELPCMCYGYEQKHAED